MLQVRLLPSFSHDTKGMLLAAATAVLYTPTDEHFGIVPLEVTAPGSSCTALQYLQFMPYHHVESTLQL